MFEMMPFARKNRQVAQYNPFRDLEEFEKNFFWNGDMMGEFKTDIKDTGKAFELEADLPGFDKKDIQIDLDDGYLTISAQRHSEAEEKDKQGRYIRCERSYGSYSRSFDVSGVNTDNITASYDNGVLKLIMPKKNEQKTSSRRLEIR